MIKSLKISLAVVLLVSTTSFVVAQSTSSTSSRKTTIEERRVEVKARVENLRANASSTRAEVRNGSCTTLVERIEKRLSNFSTLHRGHEQAYTNHVSKLKTISSKLQQAGEDVSKFNSDIAILEVKIEKFEADREAVQSGLGVTKDYSCGDQSGQFRQAVEAVRDAQKIVAEDARDIFNFINSTIKDDVMEFRQARQTEIENQ